jgi:hypothetical protein
MVDNCEGSPSIVYLRRTIDFGSGTGTEVHWWVTGDSNNSLNCALYWNGTQLASITNPASITPFIVEALGMTGNHEMLIIIQENTTGKREHIPCIRLYGTGNAPDIGHDEIEPECL